jgi:type VI secretion system protein ImpE
VVARILLQTVQYLMNAQELYRAGRLGEALKALSAEVRDNPTDARRRTFLFELLCFAGEYGRADKQLEVLAQAGPQSEIGVLLYRSALFAERQRQDPRTRGCNQRQVFPIFLGR